MATPRTAVTPRVPGKTLTLGATDVATVSFATATISWPGLTTDCIVIANPLTLTAGAIITRVWPSAANTLSVQLYNTTATDPLAVSGTINVVCV